MLLKNVDIELTGNVLSLTQSVPGDHTRKRNVQMVQLQPETAAALTRRMRMMEPHHG